jgi:hypothetical protein
LRSRILHGTPSGQARAPPHPQSPVKAEDGPVTVQDRSAAGGESARSPTQSDEFVFGDMAGTTGRNARAGSNCAVEPRASAPPPLPPPSPAPPSSSHTAVTTRLLTGWPSIAELRRPGWMPRQRNTHPRLKAFDPASASVWIILQRRSQNLEAGTFSSFRQSPDMRTAARQKPPAVQGTVVAGQRSIQEGEPKKRIL